MRLAPNEKGVAPAAVEEHLRSSQRQLEDVQKIARLGSWEHDVAADTIVWSDELYRIFGLDPDEPMDFDRMLSLLPPHMVEHVLQMHASALEGTIDEWELRVVVGREEKTLVCRVRVTHDANGQPLRVFGTAQDVTVSRKAEQRMRETEERFQLLARATNDVMWDWDLARDTLWWSEGLRTLFGYNPEEAEPDFWRKRIHPDDRQRVLDGVELANSSGASSWSAEYRFLKADDSYANVLDRGYIVRAPDTVPVRMVGAMMDITEHKQMEERLAQANRVASLGRIAASIAHEFNNVLMGIQPNLEVIRRRAGADLAVPVEHILQSVRRGKRVTDEILRFTRPMAAALKCVDVQRFLENWRSEIAATLGPRMTLTIDAPPELYVSADALQIGQVLTNLAVNARDAMSGERGSLTVTVSRARGDGALGFVSVPPSDQFVHLAVSDDGAGMTKEQLAHLFEPLFTTKRGGTGLGLAVTYQIINRHDGFISAESTPGHGSTFHIFLPETMPKFETLPEMPRALPASARVLIVEDESAVSAGIRALLELEGMETRVVDTGAAAVPAAEEFVPDAVILDIGLPDMNGIDVYVGLAERWPRLPVLFSSGHAGAAKLETYLARDNVALVLKPYDLATLRGTLGTLLRSD